MRHGDDVVPVGPTIFHATPDDIAQATYPARKRGTIAAVVRSPGLRVVQVKIAILGWGDLMCDRRGMDLAQKSHSGGSLLPVEFARFASGPRLLPVLVEGAPLQPTLWTLSRKTSVLAAATDLAVREGVWTHDVGHWKRAEAMG